MSSFYHLTKHFKPTSPGEKNNPLAPSKNLPSVASTEFNGRVCMYRAISGAVFGTDEPLKILNNIRPLINFFQVPYDEDIWGPVMAFLFGLNHYKTIGTRRAFDQAMSVNDEEGVYFISMLASQQGVSGHAVWATKDTQKPPVFHDNEQPGDNGAGTTTLRQKFNDNFHYLVFKKSAAAPANQGQFQTRVASIPPKLIRLLIKTHNMYATVPFEKETMAKIENENVAKFNKAAKLEEFDVFMTTNLRKAYNDAKYTSLLQEEIKAYWNYEKPA
jgi:hypothetical protein